MYSNFTVSIRSLVCFRTGGFRHVYYVRPNRGPHRGPTGHRASDSSETFSGLWGRLYGVLRHSCGAARQPLPYKYYKTSEFRKPYLKSGNSSKTAYSCNAEFMVSLCMLMSENLCEASHFYRIGITWVWIPIISSCFSRKTMWLISDHVFSTRAFWCHIFHSRVFSAPIARLI